MKYITFFLLFFLGTSALAQDKTAYVSIDVSASMRGDKYNLANYTVQMITALMEETDQLYFSVGSNYKKVDTSRGQRQTEINSLQQSIYSLKIPYRNTEISDIKEFIRIFKNNPGRSQWYFIVGDGYWTIGDVCSQFKNVIAANPLHVCFLETMEDLIEHGGFGECLDDMPFVKQYRSSNQPQTIINNCIQIATALFEVSDESATVKKTSGNCYSFTSEIPIKKIYIVYQDEVETKNLPVLKSASSDNKNINIARQSNVSTEKIRTSETDVLLSGQIVVLTPVQLIAANQPIELCFDKEINPSKLNIYPMVDIQLGKEEYLVETGMPDTKGNETVICMENNFVKILYELFDSEGNELPLSLLEKTRSTIVTESGEFASKLVNGIFECELPLSGIDEISYNISAKCPGYFNLTSEKKKIRKSEDCLMPVEGEMIGKNSVHIRNLMEGKTKMTFFIVNRNNPGEILNPQNFELSARGDYKYLFKDIEINNITTESFDVTVKPRYSLCECFIPDSITLTLRSTDPAKVFEPLESTVTIAVDKSGTSWLQRCSQVIIIMLILLAVIIYLTALNKKKRFKKGAMVRYQYFGVGGIKSRENVDDLRSKGFFAWFNRWFIPFPGERNSKSFAKANNKVFTFSATQSNQRVEIPKSQYNPKEMSSIDFDRDQFERKDTKSFTMSDNTYIKITLPNGTGSFQFCYDRSAGTKDDVPAFKAFTTFIIVVASLAFVILGILLLKGIF